jgi:menaquinone-dependent protoporphyrinogen IX oxidase
MVRMEGFEPPTAWFVARYSIQLSYMRKTFFLNCVVRMEGFEPPTAWFVARYSIQLSYMRKIFFLLTSATPIVH